MYLRGSNYLSRSRKADVEDLIAAGVIDPTKVVRVALQNAASVASLMLTTEAVIAAHSTVNADRAQA